MHIGRHMPTRSKMVKAAEIARQIGCEAIQIFASNPTAWRPPADDDKGCAAFAQAAQRYGLDPVVIHAPYLINLGAIDDEIWHKSVSLLAWTMRRGAQLGAKYVVFHTGSHRGAGVAVGLSRVAQGIEKVLQELSPTTTSANTMPKEHASEESVAVNQASSFLPDKVDGETGSQVMLLLENDVGAGNSLGRNFEQIAEILVQLPQYNDRLGVCLDTAHLWGAGYDISTAASTLQVLQNCEDTFGLTCLRVIHLNDTAVALGSHRDLHKRLGEGIIGSEGLQTLLRDSRLDHIAVLMETPIKTDEHDKEDWVHDAGQILKAKMLMGIENSLS